MTILVHTPYGSSCKESSLIYLFSNYLRTINLPVVQLTCNGAFSLCDRDEEEGWRRKVDSCLRCMKDQQSLAGWSGMEKLDLSRYLSSEEVILTRRMLNRFTVSQLKRASYAGLSLYDLSLASFKLRYPGTEPDFSNKKHEQLMRRYMLSAARMCLAVKRLLNTLRPDLSLIASGRDFITRSYSEQARRLNYPTAVFQMDIHDRAIKITNTSRQTTFSCPLLVNDVLTMRPDANTWPKELTQVLQDLSGFLGLSEPQISLPLAQ